jgi:hypothetical protein
LIVLAFPWSSSLRLVYLPPVLTLPRRRFSAGLVALLAAACTRAAPPARAGGEGGDRPKEARLLDKVNQFAPAKLTTDVSHLPAGERAALDKLIAAARWMDPIFDRQAYAGYATLREELAADTSEAGRLKLAYFDLMRGPWDRQAHFEPFAISKPRPEGAGFYPEDMTAGEIRSYLEARPAERPRIENLCTVIRREGDSLVAVPYSEAYAEWLKPAAALLRDAAGLTSEPSLRAFLLSRAEAFGTDDYYQSDKDWMDLSSAVQITIGPYETYEDTLLGLKAAFEAFVTVTDPADSAKLAKYKSMMPAMEENLPIPEDMRTSRGSESPIQVADLVFSSGDARKSVQTIAYNLPNDERVQAEKGAKMMLLRNVIQTKFDVIMRPIAERIIAERQLRYLSAEAFFNETLFHELSHSLGPAMTTVDGRRVGVRIALGAAHSAVEECKADVMGAYNVLYMIRRGEFPPAFREDLLVSYFAGLFRSIRFGIAEAHGRGAAVQINRFLEEGAATFDEKTSRFEVDFDKLEASIRALVADICGIQHRGDRAAADAMLARYGVMSGSMERALAGLGGIPVDLRPIYPLAGE